MYGWVVPTMPPWALTQAVGTIGAVIMPHNLYLHSGLVLSRDVNRAACRARSTRPSRTISSRARGRPPLRPSSSTSPSSPPNAESFYTASCANSTTDPGAPYACLSIAAFNMSHDTTDLSDGDVSGRACVAPNADYGSGDFGGGGTVCGAIGQGATRRVRARRGARRRQGAVPPWGSAAAAAAPSGLRRPARGGAGGDDDVHVRRPAHHGRLPPTSNSRRTSRWPPSPRAVALVPAMAVALSATFSGDYNLFNEINEFLNILQSIQLPFAMLPVLHFPPPPTCSAASARRRRCSSSRGSSLCWSWRSTCC